MIVRSTVHSVWASEWFRFLFHHRATNVCIASIIRSLYCYYDGIQNESMEKICLLCGMCMWCELSTPKIVQLLWSQIINREFGLKKWVVMLVCAQCKQMHCLLIELFSKMWIFRLVVSSFSFFICLSHVSLFTKFAFFIVKFQKTIWLKIGRGLLIVPTSFVSRHRQSVSSFKSNKLDISPTLILYSRLLCGLLFRLDT